MGKRPRRLRSLENYEEGRKRGRPRIEAVSSDDGVEANEDLTLKIVEKSLQIHGHAHSDCVSDRVTDLKEGKENTKGNKSKEAAFVLEVQQDVIGDELDTGMKIFTEELFSSYNIEGKHENYKAIEISINAVELNSVENSGNVVLRKLLRCPRYFDPPDKSWGACYNCGEEGHTAINCPSRKRMKPCYVCGSYDHIAKRCTQGLECFICQQKGHRARDCHEKPKSSKTCLKCGNSGHTMACCRSEYSSDDLNEIECYKCGNLGHICCGDYIDPGPRVVSCYRCGLSGHTGLSCTGYGVETTTVANNSTCFNCGTLGHFSRECTSSKKVGKKNSEPSTPKQESLKRKEDQKCIKSAPVIPAKKKTRNNNPIIPKFVSAGKTKQRGAWIDLGDSHAGKSKHRGGSIAQHSSDSYTRKSKQGGGWIAEYPGDLYAGKSKQRGGWIAEHPGDSYDWRSKHKDGWTVERPGDSYNSNMNAMMTRGFLETPYNRRSIITTTSSHYALSTPSSSRNHYPLEFNTPAYNGPRRIYLQNGSSSPRYIENINHLRGTRHGQW